MTLAFFTLIFTSALFFAAASPPPGCTDELVAFSACLGYVSAPPNNMTNNANSQCCDAFAKAFNSGGSNCLCYLIKQPLIFGFPLKESRVVSLLSVCASALNASSKITPRSFDTVCSGSPPLPPLSSTTTSDPGSVGLPANSATTAPMPLSFPPESVVGSTPAKVPPLTPAAHSSAQKHNCWFLVGLVTFLVSITHLQCHTRSMLSTRVY